MSEPSYPWPKRAKRIRCWRACGLARRERSSSRRDRFHDEFPPRSANPRARKQVWSFHTEAVMPQFAHALAIPDSLLAKEATDILREHSTQLLFNHSIRVYLFGAEQGRERNLRFD